MTVKVHFSPNSSKIGIIYVNADLIKKYMKFGEAPIQEQESTEVKPLIEAKMKEIDEQRNAIFVVNIRKILGAISSG